MLTEYHIVLHVNHVHNIIWVILFQEVQNLQLNTSLIGILFLVFNYL